MSYWLVSCDMSQERAQHNPPFKGAKLMSISGSRYQGRSSQIWWLNLCDEQLGHTAQQTHLQSSTVTGEWFLPSQILTLSYIYSKQMHFSWEMTNRDNFLRCFSSDFLEIVGFCFFRHHKCYFHHPYSSVPQ